MFAISLLGAAAHMPAGAGSGSRQSPIDLGDPTTNSWAIFGELAPMEVKYYKFTAPQTTATSTELQRFYFGMYVPGAGEPDFTFYVSIFGMKNDTECERWGDGWGRRLHGGIDDYDDEAPTTPRDAYGVQPARTSAAGTLWVMDSDDIPNRVKGPVHSHSRSLELLSDGDFNYHNHPNTLAFIAPPEKDLLNKFEAFSPTLFKPRGSCIANFPMAGEYRIAVWGDSAQAGKHKFSFGIGLAERDVLSVPNLMRADYNLYPIHVWNSWTDGQLLAPFIVGGIVGLLLPFLIMKCKPGFYGTSSGLASPFRHLNLIAAGLILGQFATNIGVFMWASKGASHVEKREMVIPIIMTIIVPALTFLTVFMIGLGFGCCCCCGARARTKKAWWGYRLTSFIVGLFALFIHHGYLIVPALLFLATLLPSTIANMGIQDDPEKAQDSPQDSPQFEVEVGSVPVNKIPSTRSAI